MGVPKKSLCQNTQNICSDPIRAEPICPFPGNARRGSTGVQACPFPPAAATHAADAHGFGRVFFGDRCEFVNNYNPYRDLAIVSPSIISNKPLMFRKQTIESPPSGTVVCLNIQVDF